MVHCRFMVIAHFQSPHSQCEQACMDASHKHDTLWTPLSNLKGTGPTSGWWSELADTPSASLFYSFPTALYSPTMPSLSHHPVISVACCAVLTTAPSQLFTHHLQWASDLTIIVQHLTQALINAIEEAGFDSIECMELSIPSLLLSTHQPCSASLTILLLALPMPASTTSIVRHELCFE